MPNNDKKVKICFSLKNNGCCPSNCCIPVECKNYKFCNNKKPRWILNCNKGMCEYCWNIYKAIIKV